VSELNDLYQEVILDHYKRPRNFGTLAQARSAEGNNPLCGDRLTLFVRLEGEVIREIAFQGSGCAISTASASLMTDSVKGRTRAEAEAMFATFHDVVTGRSANGGMGKLDAFAGVSEFPVRVKCATLAWHTLKAALEGQKDTVTTE
jgi:nitrogen fixation NifU-like protein